MANSNPRDVQSLQDIARAYWDSQRYEEARGIWERLVKLEPENPVFLGSWGVSDEDWVSKAHETFVAHGEQPFFAVMLSTSNHDPYEFPEGRIEPYEQPLFSRHNAMKYADFAIGKFFELARTSPYFERWTVCAASPWPVTFIDSGEAIARRALSLSDTAPEHSTAYITSPTDLARYKDVLAREGFTNTEVLVIS